MRKGGNGNRRTEKTGYRPGNEATKKPGKLYLQQSYSFPGVFGGCSVPNLNHILPLPFLVMSMYIIHPPVRNVPRTLTH